MINVCGLYPTIEGLSLTVYLDMLRPLLATGISITVHSHRLRRAVSQPLFCPLSVIYDS